MPRENTKWVYGTVTKLMGGRRFNGNYKVKYDGDDTLCTSNESRLFKASPIGEETDDSDDSNSDSSDSEEEGEGNGDNALSDEDRDAEGGMDRPEDDDEDVGDPDEVTIEGDDIPIGGTVDVKGNIWKRVATMGEDPRGDRPKSGMSMKKMHVNSHATRSDFWKELFPVPLEEDPQVVTANASKWVNAPL